MKNEQLLEIIVKNDLKTSKSLSDINTTLKLIAQDVSYVKAHNVKQNGTLARHEKQLNDFNMAQQGAAYQSDFDKQWQAKENKKVLADIEKYQVDCPASKVATKVQDNWWKYVLAIIGFVFIISTAAAWVFHHQEVWPAIWDWFKGWVTKKI